MRRTVIAFGLVLSLVVLLGAGPEPVFAKGKGEPWTGEWRTSFSTLQLKQDGKTVTGTYGNQGQFSIDGNDIGAPVPVDANGYAESPTVSSPEPGDHLVIAAFASTAAYAASGDTVTQQVNNATVTLDLSSSDADSEHACTC